MVDFFIEYVIILPELSSEVAEKTCFAIVFMLLKVAT